MGNQERVKHKRKIHDPSDASEAKRSRSEENLPSEPERPVIRAGKIAKIHIKNLFCHDSLEMVFNPNVNFIVGKNGSGKSAILAALTVGLGARASVTRRGDSHKSMIKTGKTSATIEITLMNSGSGAYKPDTYGETIKVLRTITQASSSYYTIKNSAGKIVSKKKSELDAIVSHLQIQVENPVSVLNQDTSKDFLLTATAEKKYEFFMKATQLEEIGNNYREAIRVSEESQDQLKLTHEQMLVEQKRVATLEEKIKRFDSVDDDQKKLENFKQEWLWATAIEEEFKLKSVEEATVNCEKNLEECIKEEKGQGSRGGEITTEVEELQVQARDEETQSRTLRAAFTAIKAKFAEKQSDYKEKGRKLGNCKSRIHAHETNLRKVREAIRGIEEGTGEAAEKRQRIKENIEKLKEEFDRNQSSMKTNEVEGTHFDHDKNILKEDEKNLKATRDSLLDKQKVLRGRIAPLQQQRGNTMTLFGRNMPRLMKRLEEEFRHNKLTKMPIGPVGAFINMRDSSWIPAVEKLLGFSTFSTICVDNSRDSQRVKEIMKEVYGNEAFPRMYVSRFLDHVHDVSAQSARSEDYINLLNAMEISNTTVTNFLIDSWGIESTLLIPTSRECSQILNNERTVPRNCKKAITKTGDTFYPQPKYKTYGGKVSQKKYLQVSTTEAIATIQEELRAVEAELEQVTKQLKEKRQKLEINEKANKDRMMRYNKLRNQQSQYKKKLEYFEDEINTMSGTDQNLPIYREEAVTLEENIANAKQQAKVLREEEAVLEVNMQELEASVQRQRNLFDESETKVEEIKAKIHALEEEKNQLKVHAQFAARRVQDARLQLQAAIAERDVQKRATDKALDNAQKQCRRINTKRSPDEINHLTRSLKARIEALRRELGNREELVQQLAELRLKHDEVYEFLQALIKTNDKHLKRVVDRRKQYTQMKRIMGDRVKTAFISFLELRGYTGKLHVDHKNNQLQLEVIPVNTQEREVNDAKTLSGGERSYSTIAFILALWECTQVPFYFMDEFDVYMDKINRRIVMDCLLDHAKQHPECQYGFLTPLDASNVTAGERLQIHRMTDPERR